MTSDFSFSSTSISRAVDDLRPALVAFLQELVRTPSLPNNEGPVQEKIAAALRGLGMDVDVLTTRFDELAEHPAFDDDGFSPDSRVNMVGRWPGKGSDKSGISGHGSLLLNGHVDVVSPGDLALWSEDPWSGTIRDGRLYGRGSCDMKAGLTAGIFAISSLQKIGYHSAHDLLLSSVIGEESGGVGALTTIVAGVHADAVVVLEPTRGTICPVQAGALTFRLTVQGRAAHGAMKSEGVSAIAKFLPLFQAIENLDQRRHRTYTNPLYGNPANIAPISIGTIRGGEWHSTVPEAVIIEGRCGVFPGESPAQVRALLAEAIAEAAASDPWLAAHPPVLEWFEGQFESCATPVDHPLVTTLAAAHCQIHGNDPAIAGVPYGADLRLFVNHAQMPGVLYGPGDVRLAHAADESVGIEEVVVAAKVVAGMIVEWCGVQ
jgi:acetylornithine deacetylase